MKLTSSLFSKTSVLVDANNSNKSCMPKESNVAKIPPHKVTCCDTYSNRNCSSVLAAADRVPTDDKKSLTSPTTAPVRSNGTSISATGACPIINSSSNSSRRSSNDNGTAGGGAVVDNSTLTTGGNSSSMSPVKSFVQGMVHAVGNVQEHHRKARYRKRISQCLITLRAAAEVIEEQKRQKREENEEAKEEHDDDDDDDDDDESEESDYRSQSYHIRNNNDDCCCSVAMGNGNAVMSSNDSNRASLSPSPGDYWGSALFSPLDPHPQPLHHYHGAVPVSPMVSRNSSSDEDQTDTRDPPVTTNAAEVEQEEYDDAQPEEEEKEEEKEEEEEKLPVCILPEPESLLSCNPRLLTRTMFQQLVDEGVPSALHMNAWERVFSIGRDGDAFRTLLDHCAPYQYTILVIQTTTGHLLGGFVSDAWREQEGPGRRHSYYGTGVSFLFANHPKTQSTDNQHRSPDDDETKKPLSIYPWTGKNDFCQICDKDKSILAMGGSGAFGFILEDDFYKGSTDHCGTFGNPPLTPDRDGIFTVASMEVYGLVPYGLLQDYYYSNSSLCRSSSPSSPSSPSYTVSPKSVIPDPKFNMRSLILHSSGSCED